MSGKGSRQRPGEGYAEGWDAIFGKKERGCPQCGSREIHACTCAQDDPLWARQIAELNAIVEKCLKEY